MSRVDDFRLELRVGLLILASLAATVIIILVSDQFTFESEYRITAYLKDAGGLRNGSPVTLAGLPIGKVESISTGSGKPNHPVKVVLQIKETYRLPASASLTTASIGIFGDAYLAFTGSGAPDQATDLLPTDGTAEVFASLGFLDSASQQAMVLLANVNDLLDSGTREDAKRLVRGAADMVEQVAGVTREMRGSGEQLSQLMAKVEALTDRLSEAETRLVPKVEAVLVRIDELGARVATVADHTDGAIVRLESALAAVEGVLGPGGDRIAPMVDRMGEAVEVMADLLDQIHQGHGVIGQLILNQDLAKDVNDAAINLLQVSELVLERPEALVFGMSEEQRTRWRERRDLMRTRRAFQEGWPRSPEPNLLAPDLLESAKEHAGRHTD